MVLPAAPGSPDGEAASSAVMGGSSIGERPFAEAWIASWRASATSLVLIWSACASPAMTRRQTRRNFKEVMLLSKLGREFAASALKTRKHRKGCQSTREGPGFACTRKRMSNRKERSSWCAFVRMEFIGRPISEAIWAVGYFCAMLSSFFTSSSVQRSRCWVIPLLLLNKGRPTSNFDV